MLFNINNMLFPDTFDQSITLGEPITIQVTLTSLLLRDAFVYDMNKQKGYLTLFDEEKNFKKIKVTVKDLHINESTRTGTYLFEGTTSTDGFVVGNLKVVGEMYNYTGEFIPIRQLHRLT